MMTNSLIILIYSSLLIITMILFISVVFKKNKIRFDAAYLLLCLTIMCWLGAEICAYYFTDPELIELFRVVKFIPIVPVSLLFMNLIKEYYNVKNKALFVFNWVFMLFFVATVVLAFTYQSHELFFREFSIMATEPLIEIDKQPGIWYIALFAVVQIPMVIALVIVITRQRKLPKAYRTTANLLIWLFVVYISGFILRFSHVGWSDYIDYNVIAGCIINILFFIAISSSGRPDFLNIWRRDAFDYLEDPILVADHRTVIIEANEAAEKLFGRLSIEIKGMTVGELWNNPSRPTGISFRQLEGEDHSVVSTDMYITEGKYPVVYAVERYDIGQYGKAGSGELIVFTQVTRNRLYIERLRDLAGVDGLTRLRNRFGYEQVLSDWDRDENLPLSIIIGDVNGLKSINDEHGHQAGDTLLKEAAEVLEKCCPTDGIIARIGGDEFVMVLKRHTENDTQEIIDCINESLANQDNFSYGMSIALGCATKRKASENINALVRQADAQMYEDKYGGGRVE